MNKRLIIIMLLCCAVISQIFSQKHDYNWVLGQEILDSTSGGNNTGGVILHFGDTSARPYTYTDIDIEMAQMTTSMSDADGNLAYYSNGCEVHSAAHDVVIDGDSINNDFANEGWCYRLDGRRIGMSQGRGILSLPHPTKINVYFQIYCDLEVTLAANAHASKWWINEILVNPSNPDLTVIINKKIELISGEFESTSLSAVKQPQGNKWWIITRNKLDNEYHLIDFYDIDSFKTLRQHIGIETNGFGFDQGTFSYDGTMYALSGSYDGIQLFDFDRSTGLLSNYRNYQIHEDPFLLFHSFSASGRFLYAWDTDTLYQFDLHDTDIQGSRILIDRFDGYSDPFPNRFQIGQLGPDCRIYIASFGGGVSYHVIDHPERKGTACGFRQRGFDVHTVNFGTIPNNPNYRLDNGPPCDSQLVVTAVHILPRPVQTEFVIYPQPAFDEVNVACNRDGDKFPSSMVIYNMQGQRLSEYSWSTVSEAQTVNVSHLHVGLYFLRFYDEKGWPLGGQKMVVAR